MSLRQSGAVVSFNSDSGSTIHAAAGNYVTSVFDVVHDNGLRTGLYAGKSKFSFFDRSWNATYGRPDPIGADDGRDKIDVYYNESRTWTLTNSFVAAMQADPFHYSMIAFRDPDSAGHDWFIDSTPWDDVEFARVGAANNDLASLPGSPSQGRVDLLTVVLHELGHVLGGEHEDDGLMDEIAATLSL